MIGLLLAAAAAAGTHLLYTSVVLGQRGIRSPLQSPTARPNRARAWAARSGLDEIPWREVTGLMACLGVLGGLLALAVFGRIFPAIVTAGFVSSWPIAMQRARASARRSAAMDAWPRMLEELRILTSSIGRPIPQALFEIGLRAPIEMRPAFQAAQREWLLTTDFPRTVKILKARLGDPTADATLETLLVAHEVGGADLDRRLEALIDDRRQDMQGRKDARATQAGVRFARRFVLIVPAGMALAGMSVGTGKAAYQTSSGQILVSLAIFLVVACWVWAGRIMALPDEQRVLDA